jgi:lipopolysaccharide transport system ATP-binding protein
MSHPIIQIENLGKKYSLTHRDATSRGLRHVLTDALRTPFRGFSHRGVAGEALSRQQGSEEFWALRDVCFNVAQGQAVGIIGRNGAGKSTLLKIISRITAPTTGRIRLRGRVASLLEVGTGFHPELSGRENIFLNGAILGMSQTEIKRKFDQIVAFAEVERFLDTPVKRYSSGMYMRLAFAVAAHLEPEILIVDEVLAVGDASFQHKCLGKMGEVASQQGRTVLFVSHNLAAVQRLCTECKLLEGGRLLSQGQPVQVVREYLDLCGVGMKSEQALARENGCEVRLRVVDAQGEPTRMWRYGEPLQVEVALFARQPLWRPAVDVAFYDERRTRLFALQSDRLAEGPERIEGSWTAIFRVENPGLILSEISLDLGVREGSGHYFVLIPDAGRLSLDSSRVPAAPQSDCLLCPRATQTWRHGTDAVETTVAAA